VQLTRDLFAIAKFLLKTPEHRAKSRICIADAQQKSRKQCWNSYLQNHILYIPVFLVH